MSEMGAITKEGRCFCTCVTELPGVNVVQDTLTLEYVLEWGKNELWRYPWDNIWQRRRPQHYWGVSG